MKFSVLVLGWMFTGVLTAPSIARAQMDDQFSWGLNAGAAIPANLLAKDHDTGLSAGLALAFGGVGQLFGVRVDGTLNQFGAKSGTTAGSTRIVGGTVDLVMGLFGNSDRLYVMGGAGGYGIRTGVKGEKGKQDFGLNGGLGLWLPFANAYIEARYHHFYRAYANNKPAVFIPVTFGVLF